MLPRVWAGLLPALLLNCSVKEPVREGAIFGGKGALVKELPLPVVAAAGPTTGCAATPASDLARVDDFEDADLRVFKGYHRDGYWYTAGDHTVGSKLAPEGPFSPTRLPVGDSTKENSYAAHFQAAGQTEWGALLGTTLHWLDQGVRCPIDLSAFQGVQFRAKGPGAFRFRVTVPGTTPPDYGGDCAQNCYDAPGKVVRLSDHWEAFVVTWDTLQQGGWGTEVRFDPGRVLGFEFLVDVSAMPADFWVDDLNLIPKTAPMALASEVQAQ